MVINAPHVFSALWKIAKLFVHPVTAAKVVVHSGVHKKLFDELGITLGSGVELNAKGQLVGNPPVWAATIDALLEAHESSRENFARCSLETNHLRRQAEILQPRGTGASLPKHRKHDQTVLPARSTRDTPPRRAEITDPDWCTLAVRSYHRR